MGKLIDETGNTYGYLTVIERGPNNKEGRVTWRCKCKCGNEVTVTGKSLRSGNTKSCGCYQKERAAQSNMNRSEVLIGKKIGKLLVLNEAGFIKKSDGKNVRIYSCLCDCGNYCLVQHVNLVKGETTSCGCIRSKGEFQITELLKLHKINFKKEYSFKDLVDILPLRFDFAIFDKSNHLKCLIEFQGEQHFYSNNGYYNKTLILHDNMKIEYCKKNQIPLKFIYYQRRKDVQWEEILELIGEYEDVL